MIEHERREPEPAAVADAASAPLPPLPTSLDRTHRIRRGAGWLVWIAGLTAVNIVLVVAQSDITFAAGIFLSQGIAVIGMSIANEAGMPAIATSPPRSRWGPRSDRSWRTSRRAVGTCGRSASRWRSMRSIRCCYWD